MFDQQAEASLENYEKCKTIVHTLNKYPKNEKERRQTEADLKVTSSPYVLIKTSKNLNCYFVFL